MVASLYASRPSKLRRHLFLQGFASFRNPFPLSRRQLQLFQAAMFPVLCQCSRPVARAPDFRPSSKVRLRRRFPVSWIVGVSTITVLWGAFTFYSCRIGLQAHTIRSRTTVCGPTPGTYLYCLQSSRPLSNGALMNFLRVVHLHQ